MLRFLKNSVILVLIIVCASLAPKFDGWKKNLSSPFANFKSPVFTLPSFQQTMKTEDPDLSFDFTIEYADSLVKGSFISSENGVKGTLSADHVPANLFPLDSIAGTLSLNAEISGSLVKPRLNVSVNTSNLDFSASPFAKFPLNADNISILIDNHVLTSQGSISTSDLTHINYAINLPVEFSLNPWSLNIQENSPLRGTLTAEGEIAPFLHKLLDKPTSFAGKTQIDLSLAGTYLDPQINGTCKIAQGSYEIPEIGVLLTDLSATINVNGPQLSIAEVSAVDGNGGKVFGTGYYLIDELQNYPFALDLTLQEAALLNQDYVKIICNGPLTFKGNNLEGILVGKLQTSTAGITIPERSYSTINTVDVTYINVPEKMPQPQSIATQKSSWPLYLDINLQIPKSLSIEGRDFSSIWRGEVDVQGTGRAPLLYGELKITEGQYLFNGNPFALNQATINFAGDLDKKTTLYAIASKDLDKVKVDVIAKGPVKNPTISFRSNPPLPQREILSWLLFNRGTSEISPFQGAQLSESITNLSTNQEGPDVLSKIRSTFKIDRFEIGRYQTNESAGVNVEVGKYISDNVLISVIKSDVNRIAVEATLTDQIKLQAQVGDDSEGKLLLRWKKDY